MSWIKSGCVTAVAASLLALVTPAESDAASAERGWSRHNQAAASAAREGGPVVIEVFVPLCSDKRGGSCGDHPGAGDARDLERNIYWGAVYGARRYLDRGWLGWKRTEQTSGDGSELERVTYHRSVSGSRWGSDRPVDVFVVLHAFDGDANREALDRFRERAASGGSVKFNDGSALREERVHIVGFMGRNPLLDNGKPPRKPDLPEPSSSADAIPSFSISAHSRETLGRWLHKTGSPALVLARGAVASEGYLLEAVLRGVSENDAGHSIRRRATDTYAKHQKLMKLVAETYFAPQLPAQYTTAR